MDISVIFTYLKIHSGFLSVDYIYSPSSADDNTLSPSVYISSQWHLTQRQTVNDNNGTTSLRWYWWSRTLYYSSNMWVIRTSIPSSSSSPSPSSTLGSLPYEVWQHKPQGVDPPWLGRVLRQCFYGILQCPKYPSSKVGDYPADTEILELPRLTMHARGR